jgi:integrase
MIIVHDFKLLARPTGIEFGYRRLKGQGKWVVRFYLGKGGVRSSYRGHESTKDYEKTTFAEADDFSDANGVSVLTFDQAQARAREMVTRRVFDEAGIVSGPYTVRAAMHDYIQSLKHSGKDYKGAQTRANALILPDLGDIEVASLTSKRLRRWLNHIAHKGARLRTAKGKPQKYRAISSEEQARARKTTANRTLTILKAALNHAYDEGRATSNDAWGRRVKPFRGVQAARLRYLTVAEAKRLINASGEGLRDLVQCALQTGCRLSEISRLTVADFNRDTGTVYVQKSKSGKARHVVLTDEGCELFAALCAGRAGDERLMRVANKTAVARLVKQAIAKAHITPAISFHGLRHTWASLAIMNGVPLHVIAHNLGHADTRMVERHYGHMARSHVVDAIRAGAPRFGVIAQDKVRGLR